MSDLSKISVAILAGGLGTHLASVVPGRQKVVVKIGKRPFLEYVLIQLNKAGFRKIVICTGHLADQVREAFGDTYQSLSLQYSKEKSPLGTAGAIRFALPLLTSKNILVMNGDTFLETDLKKFFEFHLKKGANGTIIVTSVASTSRYGSVELDKNDRIVSFEEKKENGGVGFINGGMCLFKRPLLFEIPESKTISLEKDMFPTWVGKRLYGYKSNGGFIDIGIPESYKEAEDFFSQYKI